MTLNRHQIAIDIELWTGKSVSRITDYCGLEPSVL